MRSLPRFRRPDRSPAGAEPPGDRTVTAPGADRALLVKVRSRTAIAVRRRTQHLLDGEYGSIHRGRSMDFEDLRDYVVGDDVKDIDWKATARSGRPLVKRNVAERRHGVLFVVDSGRSMAAMADATSSKRDVVVLATGLIGQLAMRHGDSIGLVVGPTSGPLGGSTGIAHVPFGRGEAHLEQILRTIHSTIDLDGSMSDLDGLLDHVARQFRRRLIVVVLADDIDLDSGHLRRIRRLCAQHEVLYCAVGDMAITEPALASQPLRHVEGHRIPAFFRDRPRLHADLQQVAAERRRRLRAALTECGAASTRLSGADTTVSSVFELLERQRLAVAEARR